jgi:hypothetical protein
MTKTIGKADTGLKRIFAQFTRTSRSQVPWRGSRWHEDDIASRGL